jgi:hypothetical protein
MLLHSILLAYVGVAISTYALPVNDEELGVRAAGHDELAYPAITRKPFQTVDVGPVSEKTCLPFGCAQKCVNLCQKSAALLRDEHQQFRDLVFRYLQLRKNRRQERNKAIMLGATAVGSIIPSRNYLRYRKMEKALAKQLQGIVSVDEFARIQKLKNEQQLRDYLGEDEFSKIVRSPICKACRKSSQRPNCQPCEQNIQSTLNGPPPPGYPQFGNANQPPQYNQPSTDNNGIPYPMNGPYYSTYGGGAPNQCPHTHDNGQASNNCGAECSQCCSEFGKCCCEFSTCCCQCALVCCEFSTCCCQCALVCCSEVDSF